MGKGGGTGSICAVLAWGQIRHSSYVSGGGEGRQFVLGKHRVRMPLEANGVTAMREKPKDENASLLGREGGVFLCSIDRRRRSSRRLCED